MTVEQIVFKFNQKPYLIGMGAGKISKRFKCSKEDIYEARKIVKNTNKKELHKFPKILIFDIETSPSISYTFGRFKYNIAYNQVEQEPIMLTWSAKWLYSSEVISDKITKEEVLNVNDCRIVTSLWNLMNKSDIVVAHYGDRFDLPMLNTRAILNGLPPYNTIRSIDTKKVASDVFKFPSNKLDALAKYFELSGKIDTEFQLWINCLKGDTESIKEMETYNIQDVKLLEEVYLKLRPYIKSHPNIGIYMEKEAPSCSNCGSESVKFEGNFFYTHTGKYPIYRCKCGAQSRGRKSILEKNISQSLLISVPGR